MIDLKLPNLEANLLRRGYAFPDNLRVLLDEQRRCVTRLQELRARLNLGRGIHTVGDIAGQTWTLACFLSSRWFEWALRP